MADKRIPAGRPLFAPPLSKIPARLLRRAVGKSAGRPEPAKPAKGKTKTVGRSGKVGAPPVRQKGKGAADSASKRAGKPTLAGIELQTIAAASGPSAAYWSSRTVARAPHGTREESLRFLSWRNHQYLGYSELMPTGGADGLRILDYGCGPGNDLVGFTENSKPARLVGMDVSPIALNASRERLTLHQSPAELIRIFEDEDRLPLEDASIDLIHTSGVLHHTPHPERILAEFKRILAPGGRVQVMVYNRESVWLHLYAAYLFRNTHGIDWSVGKEEVFRQSTDGPDCPISRCYSADEFIALAAGCGFAAAHAGNAISFHEMMCLPRRFEAIRDQRLDEDSRAFLYGLEFDSRDVPLHRGQVAGIDCVFHLAAA